MERRRERWWPIAALLPVLLGACGGSTPTSSNVSAPRASSSASSDGRYVIGCEESFESCVDEAKRVCPSGYRTVQEGEGGFYAEGEDWRHPPPVLRRRPYYRQEGWVIECQRAR